MGFHIHQEAPFDGDGNLSCAAAAGHFAYGDQVHALPGNSFEILPREVFYKNNLDNLRLHSQNSQNEFR